MKPRVYLDTSVISALVDQRAPERRALTMAFWNRRSRVSLITCAIARDEIDATPDAGLRGQMHELLAEVEVHDLDDDIRHLASRYIVAGVFTETMRNDALHAAAAAVLRADVLLSWNFRHLVNRRRRLAVNAVNVAGGFATVDIISPPEI